MKRQVVTAVVFFFVGCLVSMIGCGPPLQQCEAYPVCADGFHEVDECPDNTTCDEASICGVTILCAEDPPLSCDAEPTCRVGGTAVASQSECPQDGVACYEVTECGSTIWCWEPAGDCHAEPTCSDDATEVASQSDCPQDDVLCYEVTECGSTIWCWEPAGDCHAEPVCPEDATEVANESECPQDDVNCYEVTECGSTIWCWEPVDAQCPDAADPEVHYISEDPLECAAILFGCDDSQTAFSDECGCGCIGPEEGSGNSCGGESGDTCEADEFCLDDDRGNCVNNGVGTCVKRPDGDCLTVVDPVCGCDGQTYNNSCEARQAGQDYSAEGACES